MKCKNNITYEYVNVNIDETYDRDPTWLKYKTIIDKWDDLQKYDIIVNLDTDAWIKDYNKFEEWLNYFASIDKVFMYSAEVYCTASFKFNMQQYINGGMTIFKPNEYTSQVITDIYNMPEQEEYAKYKKVEGTNGPPGCEQICISYYVTNNEEFKKNILLCPDYLFNTPVGTIITHCWWKEYINDIILLDLYKKISSY